MRWAWAQLYRRFGVGEPYSFTAAWLGVVCGSRKDPRKAGKRYLATLERNGLIEISPERHRGQVTVRLLDPEVAWVRIRREIEAEQGFFPDFEPPREAEPNVVQFQPINNNDDVSAKAAGKRPTPAEGDKSRGETEAPPTHQPPLSQMPVPAADAMPPPREQPATTGGSTGGSQPRTAGGSSSRSAATCDIEARAQFQTSNINISDRDRDVIRGYGKPAVLGQDPPARSAGDVASGIYADLDEKDRKAWARMVAESQAARQRQPIATSEQAAWINEFVEYVWRRLADDQFGKSEKFPAADGKKMLWKFGWDAWFDRESSTSIKGAIESLLNELDLTDGSGRLRTTRAQYFMGGLKAIYDDADAGVIRPPWPLKKKGSGYYRGKR